jgi:hypothetical protein
MLWNIARARDAAAINGTTAGRGRRRAAQRGGLLPAGGIKNAALLECWRCSGDRGHPAAARTGESLRVDLRSSDIYTVYTSVEYMHVEVLFVKVHVF